MSHLRRDESIIKVENSTEGRTYIDYENEYNSSSNGGNYILTPNPSVGSVDELESIVSNKFTSKSNEVESLPDSSKELSANVGDVIELPDGVKDINELPSYKAKLSDNSNEYSDPSLIDRYSGSFGDRGNKLGSMIQGSGDISIRDNEGVESSTSSVDILSKYSRTKSNQVSRLPDHYSGNDEYIKMADWMGMVNSSANEKIKYAKKFKKTTDMLSYLGDTGSKAASYLTSIMGQSGSFFEPVPSYTWSSIKELNALGLARATVDSSADLIGARGITKQRLLDEALALAEWGIRELNEKLDQNKDKLPGSSSSGIGKVINTVKNVTGKIDDVLSGRGLTKKTKHSDPERAPKGLDESHKKGVIPEGSDYIKVYDTSNLPITNVLSTKYLSDRSAGLGLTLRELCDTNINDISNFTDLNKALYEGKLSTSWGKIQEVSKYGLDSNDKWEVVIFPYKSTNNGNYSFLPDFSEIRTENMRLFGLNVGYDNGSDNNKCWLPITSFELQSKKLTQKSVGLYDGDFSIPVSMEFTNELRLSISDDNLKSFRRYFKKCADVAIYNSYRSKLSSEITSKWSGYDNISDVLTLIDYSSIAVAVYKNVTFQCDIYIMSEDKQTIKKFSLLVVLRDFPEEYSGEIDGGPTDLSLHFSIVGDLMDNEDYESKDSKLIEFEGTNFKEKAGNMKGFSDNPKEPLSEGDIHFTKSSDPSADLEAVEELNEVVIVAGRR